MYRKISEIICVLRKLDVFELEHMGLDVSVVETCHDIKHKYKDEVIIPIVAMNNAYDFFIFSESAKRVVTADGVKCNVVEWGEYNICDIEDEITRLYNMDAWSFMKVWRNSFPQMTSMQFIKMKLEKYEDKAN